MHPYVGHFTVPVLGLPTEPPSPDDTPEFADTWLPSIEAFHASGVLLGFTGLIEERVPDNTWGAIEQMGVVVQEHGVCKILFAPDRIFETGGAALLCAAYEALQHRQRHLPYHRLFTAWAAHKPDGETIYAKVFSHPKGWVIGLETPRDALDTSFEPFDALDAHDSHGDDSDEVEPLDLCALEDDGEFDMGAIAAVVVRITPAQSAHTALRHTEIALEHAREIYDAWLRSCAHWVGASTLGIPADLPIRLSSRVDMVDFHEWT